MIVRKTRVAYETDWVHYIKIHSIGKNKLGVNKKEKGLKRQIKIYDFTKFLCKTNNI